MNTPNISLLQQLVQASNRSKARKKTQDETHLNFLAYLSLMLKESEALIREVNHQTVAQRTLAGLA